MTGLRVAESESGQMYVYDSKSYISDRTFVPSIPLFGGPQPLAVYKANMRLAKKVTGKDNDVWKIRNGALLPSVLFLRPKTGVTK